MWSSIVLLWESINAKLHGAPVKEYHCEATWGSSESQSINVKLYGAPVEEYQCEALWGSCGRVSIWSFMAFLLESINVKLRGAPVVMLWRASCGRVSMWSSMGLLWWNSMGLLLESINVKLHGAPVGEYHCEAPWGSCGEAPRGSCGRVSMWSSMGLLWDLIGVWLTLTIQLAKWFWEELFVLVIHPCKTYREPTNNNLRK